MIKQLRNSIHDFIVNIIDNNYINLQTAFLFLKLIDILLTENIVINIYLYLILVNIFRFFYDLFVTVIVPIWKLVVGIFILVVQNEQLL